MIYGRDKKDLVGKLNERLADYPPECAGALAQAFADAFAEKILEAPSGVLGAMVGKYAIRSDQVKLFDLIASALPAAAGVGFFIGSGPVLGAAVTIGVAIVRLAHSLATQGVTLDDGKIRVLTILRFNIQRPQDRGMTVDEILEVIERTQPNYDSTWVKQQLEELSSMPTSRGTTEIVSHDTQGRWRPHA